MFAENFKKWNTLTGWATFLIALITYGLTVEPTLSFWDCGEYIATSANLEVGHPPGAPFFQMMGAFFAMFAPEADQVAKMVNHMSGVSAAFAVLFLFWTITNLTRKLIKKDGALTNAKAIAVLGSGLVGALALTFSDSFWFNAVETEVYAMASFIMALLPWLGLQWIDNLETPRGNKWLILIAFVVGLTFGIQFMGFLAIPSIGLMYYFKKYKTTTVKNFLIANIAVIAVLMFVYKFSLTYTLQLFGWGEVFFVNSIGLPFNSGTIIIGLLFIGAFYYALRYTRKRNLANANTIVLCFMFMFIGFSSWLMLPIRANANVVINENDPADARQLLAYYNREQYPGVESPIYGTYYTNMFGEGNANDPYKDDNPKYERDEKTGKYVIVNDYEDVMSNSDPNHVGLLPRMWSQEHAENYIKYFGGPELKPTVAYSSSNELRSILAEFNREYKRGNVDAEQYIQFINKINEEGNLITVEPPSLWQNLKFMFEYQFGYMYWRYFMWNFSGRQDDVQGRYDNHGNWLTGINFIDNNHLGSQENLPSDIKNNKARNTYYLLPLILGVIGLIFQFRKDKKQFWTWLVFFLFTGIAIQFYTNVRPFEPRERDYSLVGSFYVFSMWIGLGVYALFDEFKKLLTPKVLAPVVTIVCLLAVPTVMAYQNWDDHDRSNKYTARAMARAYLDSIQEDAGAILYTIGDNDTFAVWYAQQVEGYRTDVRPIVTSYFNTDWYIDQMKSQAYTSDPIPSQLTHDKYVYGTRDVIYYNKLTDERWDINRFMDWIANDDNNVEALLKRQGRDISQFPSSYLKTIFYPTNKVRIPVNKENVLKSGLVKQEDAHLIVDYIDIDLPQSALTKNRIMMLDVIANNNWERPIYFTGGSFDNAEYIWMKDHLQLDGLVFKLVPIKTPINPRSPFDMGRIDSELMYDIVMKWDWGNMGDPNIYHDTETRRQSISYRNNLARLLEKLLSEDKKEKAKNVIELAMTNMPVGYFGYYWALEPFMEGYYKVDETEKARELFKKLATIYQEHLNYYAALDFNDQSQNLSEIYNDIEAYRRLLDITVANDTEEYSKTKVDEFNTFIEKFEHFYEDDTQLPDELFEEQVNDSTALKDSTVIDTLQADTTTN
jgi:cbb3-type cytochrome oxidase subunit 3